MIKPGEIHASYTFYYLMTIRVNQPWLKLRVLCDILCVLCGIKQPEHNGHEENAVQSSQCGYRRTVIYYFIICVS